MRRPRRRRGPPLRWEGGCRLLRVGGTLGGGRRDRLDREGRASGAVCRTHHRHLPRRQSFFGRTRRLTRHAQSRTFPEAKARPTRRSTEAGLSHVPALIRAAR